jgi:serine/threonine-protein kinase
MLSLMRSLPEVARRLHGGTTALDLDTESGRAFLQERVAFWNKVNFLISGCFFLAGAVMTVGFIKVAADAGLNRFPAFLHFATLLVSLGAWQLCRRRPGLTTGALHAIDTLALALPVLGFSLQTFLIPPVWAGEVADALVLIFTSMATSRAILVPSSSAHTVRVTTLAALPVIGAILTLPDAPGLMPTMAGAAKIWSLLWVACAAVIATLASYVIYGLREEIRQARRLGQYTLQEKLGEGGMGAVYRASHAMLRRPTAIKLLPPDKAGEVALGRFEREVQLTASLSHPNTISVFDYGRTPDGIFYYVMEYLDGTNLDELVRVDGPQPPARVAHILRQVASALVEAHGVGLIHRDIKPENVILCERGGIPDVAKVLDFGLVKDLERGTEARLTQANVVQGTPLYLSPEAINAPDAVGARSDLYSLGAVGYYLLTGTHVFAGQTLVEVCSHHLHTAPDRPSERLEAPIPVHLEQLILTCLEKDAERRPASATALRDALQDLEGMDAWDDDVAREWWDRWRQRRKDEPPKRKNGGSVTVSIAVDERKALW